MSAISDDEITRRAELIIEMGGINPPFEEIYEVVLAENCRKCLSAYDFYNRCLFESEQRVLKVDINKLRTIAASSIHESLLHAASISRFLWPSGLGKKSLKKLKMARAERLKEKYCISERSALSNRQIRDALEHFDERLDKFSLICDAGQIYPMPTIGSIDFLQDGVTKIFMLVDPKEEKIVIFNEIYHFGNILSEVRSLQEKIVYGT